MNGKKARLRRKSRPNVAPVTEAEVDLAAAIAAIRTERAAALGEHDGKGRKKLDALAEKNNAKIRALQGEINEAAKSHASERNAIAHEYDLQIMVAQSERRELRKARREQVQA